MDKDKVNVESEQTEDENLDQKESSTFHRDFSTNLKNKNDITFYFFYDLVKKLILKRHDVGGKFCFFIMLLMCLRG